MSGNRSLTVAAQVWLLHFLLRFAGRSPLPDSSHTEEAGRRFFGGERSRFAERHALCPPGSEGRGWRSG